MLQREMVLMEVCVDTYQSALEAVKGGAGRLELCSALSEDGLTPSPGTLITIKQDMEVPVFCMIRPRGGDFLYTEPELKIMEKDMKILKDQGADGFVFGALDPQGRVDSAACERLLQAAAPHPCTFHRAFDATVEPISTLDEVIRLGFTRLLTSGLASTANEGIRVIQDLVQRAQGRIKIMPGSGINEVNVGHILRVTGAREFHGSGRVLRCSNMNHVNPGFPPSPIHGTSADKIQQILAAARESITEQ
ncbi:unnamed protein product [Darwinula stevensoni]|uniref:Copper homeostasis protein cutC homolog n=1 Tax=Darwinula stevensoni TaxID=69355 RepID=A0A7R8ZZJ6_9CRUS|nr:unnamed protein product [Darwinula stevensoni]CAG0882636.1 unnamed protein product [Darwinula stevensoni]